jgi:dTDP-4-dehydrorhamnose 3,5-epimerase
MIFSALDINGAWRIDVEKRDDERGFLARTFCAEKFAAHGLHAHFPQSNVSVNHRRGALRGMHYQDSPRPDSKLVRCANGAIFDVILDLRPDSPTYLRWQGVELTAESFAALFIPAGCAHGFQCLTDDAQVFYQMGEFYVAELSRGVRWNDPAFAIQWPLEVTAISPRDAAFADFTP